ncbi:MAG: hypothetical protein RIC15_06160 [Vicingaceae bacterium]
MKKALRILKKLVFSGDQTGKALFLFVFFTLTAIVMYAPPPPPPPPNIPIDGGIGWLVAAGIAYGTKKSYDLSKKRKDQ